MISQVSTFAQIVDKISLMNDEQQKLLWLQLNKEAIYAAAAKADGKKPPQESLQEKN